MEKFFSIKKAAEITGLTAETLRHYDRIGLVKPAAVSPDTKYRYYTQKEVIRLNTVHALRCMDFSLERIRAMLGSEDFGEIVAMLKEATENADKKIAELTEAKARIERAKSFYEAKAARNEEHGEPFVRTLPRARYCSPTACTRRRWTTFTTITDISTRRWGGKTATNSVSRTPQAFICKTGGRICLPYALNIRTRTESSLSPRENGCARLATTATATRSEKRSAPKRGNTAATRRHSASRWWC